ncbi:MAG: Spy/CpxP family protein refolding chaperone [Bacteroidales bacterium]|nr:Spy/CpxP family protein refolding chaperone [Bacteroidales bacterium]MDX9931017.1 Spy/CpxP family protein refolding chaperone [Bacteroidales bacterium]HPB02587.1 Spy/CpxP family protein refolding chaperone [Bacteroidales bacterium]
MKQIFLMAIIAFFAVTISTAQTQQGQPKANCGQGMQMHQGGGGCNCIPNLTDEQMKKMEPLKLAFHKQKFEIHNQIKAKEAQLIVVSTGDKINKEEAYKLIEEIAALKASLEKAQFDHRMAVRALLTPEQQLAFDMHVAKGGDKCGDKKGADNNCKPQGGQGCGQGQMMGGKCQGQGNMQGGSCCPDGQKAAGCSGSGKGMQQGQGGCSGK